MRVLALTVLAAVALGARGCAAAAQSCGAIELETLTVPANGLDFHVIAAGRPGAPLAVFIHGWVVVKRRRGRRRKEEGEGAGGKRSRGRAGRERIGQQK